MSISRKARLFWPLAFVLVLTDCTTKELAVERLTPAHVPHEVIGSVVRLTLNYNPNAALGIQLGSWTRPVLLGAGLVVLGILLAVYRRAPGADRKSAIALAFVVGGAVGNLLDRVRSPQGVVDFIDVGIGSTRFWTFNAADVFLWIGALLLAGIHWRSEASAGDLPRHTG